MCLRERIAMAISKIYFVRNLRSADVRFYNLESPANSYIIPSGAIVDVKGVPVPWCPNATDFSAHHIEIQERNSGAALFYIWQRNASGGDFVRMSETGFVDPGQRVIPAGEPLCFVNIGRRSGEDADSSAGDNPGVTIGTE
jgi:hypothetical protein